MALLAFIPSVSVLAVVSRTTASGFGHGLATALGITAGDILYILIAVLGLSVIAESMDRFFVIVKYLGGAYLIWLGIQIWRSGTASTETGEPVASSLWASFSAGLLITLADQKAILFYLGLFPALFDLAEVTFVDTGVIVVVAIVAVGGPKAFYAYLAHRTTSLPGLKTVHFIESLAGAGLIGIGFYLLFNA